MSNQHINQASEDELQPFTSLFQNAAVARDYVPGCISEEDINELAVHILFIEPTYKYDISKAPIDNVFSAYRIAVEALIRTEKLKLLDEVRERVVGEGDLVDAEIFKKLYDKAYSNGYNDKGYENSYNSRDYRSAEDIAPIIAKIRGGYDKKSAALNKLEAEL